MKSIARFLLLACGLSLGGCVVPQYQLETVDPDAYTPTQLEALQTRVVEAGPDAAFAAASGAVMDSGFVVEVNDAKLRILSATRRQEASPAANAASMAGSAWLTWGVLYMKAPATFTSVAVRVLPAEGGRSSVRIMPFHGIGPKHDPEIVRQLWVLMERRLMER